LPYGEQQEQHKFDLKPISQENDTSITSYLTSNTTPTISSVSAAFAAPITETQKFITDTETSSPFVPGLKAKGIEVLVV